MNSGKTIFSQIMEYLPSYEFRQCVRRYPGQYKIKSFSCRDQFLCMSFAQLTYRESLRDIQVWKGRSKSEAGAVEKCSGLLGSDQFNWLILWMNAERRGLFSALEGHFRG